MEETRILIHRARLKVLTSGRKLFGGVEGRDVGAYVESKFDSDVTHRVGDDQASSLLSQCGHTSGSNSGCGLQEYESLLHGVTQ